MKLLSLSRFFLNKKCYSSCSIKDILKTQPVGSKKKLKVILYVLMLLAMYTNVFFCIYIYYILFTKLFYLQFY